MRGAHNQSTHSTSQKGPRDVCFTSHTSTLRALGLSPLLLPVAELRRAAFASDGAASAADLGSEAVTRTPKS